MKVHIKAENKYEVKNIKHTGLKDDLKQMNIHDTFLENCGRICAEPEEWLIECAVGDDDLVCDYSYDLESEYINDCKILGLK